MMHIQTNPPKQVLLRLPDDLAAKLARAVAPRQRNRYIVELLEKTFAAQQEAESRMLTEACEAMNALEAADPEFAREGQEWLDADLTGSVDDWDPDFDRETFEREFAIAQAALRAKEAAGKATVKKGRN